MDGFEALPGFVLSADIERAFREDGITTPTEAQSRAFAAILAGQHLVLDSGTGTGKTLAYLLPLLQRLSADETTRVVVVTPATELAIQTLRVATRYKSEALNVGALVGGGNQKKQKDRVQKSTRLIVGTPGRVLEMTMARKLKGVTTFVLDEPEPILNSKDADFLLEVLSRPPRPQLVLVGATFGAKSSRAIAHLMAERAVRVETGDRPLVTRIAHLRVRVRDAADRELQLKRFMQGQKVKRAIIYVHQPHLIRHLFRELETAGFRVATLSDERTKQQREEAIRKFSLAEADVLLVTDRAATGIDIDSVPWVIHFELPRSAQAYVHRAGRTARAGKSGASVALVSDEERIVIKRLEQELGIRFEEVTAGA